MAVCRGGLVAVVRIVKRRGAHVPTGRFTHQFVTSRWRLRGQRAARGGVGLRRRALLHPAPLPLPLLAQRRCQEPTIVSADALETTGEEKQQLQDRGHGHGHHRRAATLLFMDHERANHKYVRVLLAQRREGLVTQDIEPRAVLRSKLLHQVGNLVCIRYAGFVQLTPALHAGQHGTNRKDRQHLRGEVRKLTEAEQHRLRAPEAVVALQHLRSLRHGDEEVLATARIDTTPDEACWDRLRRQQVVVVDA